MSSQAMAKEGRFLRVDFAPMGIGLSYQLSLNLDDHDDVKNKVVALVEIGQAPLRAKIHELTNENELLKKQALTADELRHLAATLKNHFTETRFDGRLTNDDVLVAKLEALMKS